MLQFGWKIYRPFKMVWVLYDGTKLGITSAYDADDDGPKAKRRQPRCSPKVARAALVVAARGRTLYSAKGEGLTKALRGEFFCQLVVGAIDHRGHQSTCYRSESEAKMAMAKRIDHMTRGGAAADDGARIRQ